MPPAPWSVPPDEFAVGRRPNSVQMKVRTRSARPRRCEVVLEGRQRRRRWSDSALGEALGLVVVRVEVRAAVDGRDARAEALVEQERELLEVARRTPSPSGSRLISPSHGHDVLDVADPGSGGCGPLVGERREAVGDVLRRSARPRGRPHGPGRRRGRAGEVARRPPSSCRRLGSSTAGDLHLRRARALHRARPGAELVSSVGRQPRARRQPLERVVARAVLVQPAAEPPRRQLRGDGPRSPRRRASGSARDRGWRSRCPAAARACPARRGRRGRRPARRAATGGATASCPSAGRPSQPRACLAAVARVDAVLVRRHQRVEQVEAAGQEDVDEDARWPPAACRLLGALDPVLERQRASPCRASARRRRPSRGSGGGRRRRYGCRAVAAVRWKSSQERWGFERAIRQSWLSGPETIRWRRLRWSWWRSHSPGSRP